MDVAILGTSNSLSTSGYTAHLARPSLRIVANVSLGSSTSVVIPYRLPLLENTSVDILVLDTCVNEQAALHEGLHNEAVTEAVFNSTVAWCIRQAVMPIVLVMPVQFALPRALEGEEPKVLTLYKQLCERNLVKLVDGYRLACKLVRSGRSLGEIFRDTHHPAAEFQSLIGDVVAEEILLEHRVPVGDNPVPSVRFVPVTAMDGVASEKVHHQSNSIVSAEVLRLDIGDHLTFRDGEASRVLGVVFNMIGPCAALSIGNQVKRLDCWERSVLPFQLAAWSLLNPVPVGGGLVVACVPVDGRPAERNEHNCEEDLLSERSVEIVGLVVAYDSFN
jgi:hypothetical protein